MRSIEVEFERAIRARMKQTGETYEEARSRLAHDGHDRVNGLQLRVMDGSWVAYERGDTLLGRGATPDEAARDYWSKELRRFLREFGTGR